jgi:segregation and condensation protein A
LARIQTLLAEHPAGGDLAAFLPPVAGEATDRPLRARAAVASTFLAGLELAREGTLTLAQDLPFQELQLTGAPSSFDERAPASAAAA